MKLERSKDSVIGGAAGKKDVRKGSKKEYKQKESKK
jgi:hypothetical protein